MKDLGQMELYYGSKCIICNFRFFYWAKMPAMGGGRGGGLMVPRGGMGRRSSCYPGGPGGGIPPSVHKAGRRASSRSEAGIGLFPGLLGGGKNQVIIHKIEQNHKRNLI